MKKHLTYKNAGVDIEEGEKLIELIKPLAKNTFRKEVIGGIGGFGAYFKPAFKGMKDPVLVSSTDGVGTKLKVAFLLDKHSTIGIDLVAMSVNDVLTSGAEPLFFLDYFATGSLDSRKASLVIKGIAAGCKEAGCALIGGETAEMPGIYKKDDYDLAGFCVGAVDRKKLIDGSGIKEGDRIIGLSSSGLHSNGYSLARKIIFEKLKLHHDDKVVGIKKTIGQELLTPTRIYVKTILKLLKKFDIKGIAHITGGGFPGNLPRILPSGVKAMLNINSWEIPPIFGFLQEKGGITDEEMLRTFNCGIGMAFVVNKKDVGKALRELSAMKEPAYAIGFIAKKTKKEPPIEFL